MTDAMQIDLAHSEVGVQIGDTIADKYRVDAVLGEGGMAVVVKAMHLELREPVAIKILLSDFSQHPEAASRFLQEARASARLKSPHVARSSDVGTLPTGQRYMVMEYLAGTDLANLIARRGPLSPEVAVEYVIQACDGVAEAHELGIVHRDIKPANLFLVRDPDGTETVKVLDFGISKATELVTQAEPFVMTRTHATIGTPVYASPEQLMRASEVDRRTDIWSLGVVLHELITGQQPFSGRSLEQLVARVAAAEPTPLRELCPAAPERLESIVLRCLEKEREARYACVADLVSELASAVPAALSVEARVAVERILRRPRSVPPSAESTRPEAGGASPGQRAPRGRRGSSDRPVVVSFDDRTLPPTRQRRRAAWWRPAPTAIVLGVAALLATLTGLYLRPGVGNLTVDVLGPAGAAVTEVKIWVDDEIRCVSSPCSLSGLESGHHLLRITASGYLQPADRAVVVRRGDTRTVVVHLLPQSPERGTEVASPSTERPPGRSAGALATAAENGAASLPRPSTATRGRAIPSPPAAPPGAESDVSAGAAGAPSEVALGQLSINSIPASRVVVDGRPRGHTPLVVSLPAGVHDVTFVHPDRGRRHVTVQVIAGQTALAAVKFE